jgi:hypothetical protein
MGFLVSAVLIGMAGRGAPADEVPALRAGPSASAGAAMRIILATPVLRWTAVITVTLALGFYAQFASGLPAYAITVLEVSESTIGTASAVNCLVIVALQMAVMKWTAKRSSPSLLVAVGSIWVFSWLLLAASSVVPALAATMFVVVYGVFVVGETMYAPVLNPLTASLARPAWSAPRWVSSRHSRPACPRRVPCWPALPSTQVTGRCSSGCTWASASLPYSRRCACARCWPARACRTLYRRRS